MCWIETTMDARKECEAGCEKATKVLHFDTGAMIYLCDKHFQDLKVAIIKDESKRIDRPRS